MPMPTRLQRNDDILTTWQNFCRQDQVIQISIRPEQHAEPSQCHAASHLESLAQRKAIASAIARRRVVPEYQVQPSILQFLDYHTMDLVVDDGTFQKLERVYLLGKT